MSDATGDLPDADAPKIGNAWGDDISEERQRELDAILAAWDAETDHGNRKGPFDLNDLPYVPRERAHLKLTGADVFYLAQRSNPGTSGAVPDLHLEGANLNEARLEGADLGLVHLEGAHLARARLTGVRLDSANLQHALFNFAQLQHVDLRGAKLQQARLNFAQMQHADLRRTQLQGADFEGSVLTNADLRFARLDRDTNLTGISLVGASLDQVLFDNTNLTVVSWEGVAPLGDEGRRRAKTYEENDVRRSIRAGGVKTRQGRIEGYEAAVRANRLLATALRAQGLAEDADIFAYRAALMQRGLRFQRRQFGRWLTSWGLAALSGYGYRLGRIFAAYAIVVLTFAALFLLPTFLNGAIPTIQQAADALQISLNAIHGRVFFAQFHLDTLQSWLATAESVVGIVIEGVFVAMIIQRLFR